MALLVRRRPRAGRLVSQSVFLGTRTETEEQQRPRLAVDCGLEYLMSHERVGHATLFFSSEHFPLNSKTCFLSITAGAAVAG